MEQMKIKVNKVYTKAIERVSSKIDVRMYNPQKIENLSELEEKLMEYNRLVKELFIFNLPKLTVDRKTRERIDELLDAMSEYFEYPTEDKKKALEEKREVLKDSFPCVCLGWDKKRKEVVFEGYKFHVSGE